ncbi:glycine zipper 2TM domain-containing protein [Silanimonas sp.]|uniref:glycine zipper 2TM domain-containing protein n=1 Tax=Silanimonas sp. TaxID=1929290 RepID=UPI001BC03AA3|nr:glycine zipper 2TM domain-containing protein [Silanimonas sp.]MBS3896415.1 glycine zipper 2TM domain-containing protein [Silanimonas sp.]MBS3924501.1 glycine zipper 2TM domain-containing protein [Xanthomonadaceae bacterium]
MTRHAALIPLVLVLATAAGAAPARSWDGPHDRHALEGPRWSTARVLSAEPIFASGGPRWREECWQEPVRYVSREYVPGGRFHDRHHGGGIGPSTGQVLGGIVGAAVGNQIGDGDGQRAATVAGALLGSAIARDNQRRHDGWSHGEPYAGGRMIERESVRYEQRCRSVETGGRRGDRVIGYHVTYEYAGHTFSTRTAQHPGRNLRVRIDVQPEF